MSNRREVRQLREGDLIEVQLSLHCEVISKPGTDGMGERVKLHVKPMRCGEDCGVKCQCQHEAFDGIIDSIGLALKPTQRVPFVGNLAELLAQRKETEARIAMIEASRRNGDPNANEATSAKPKEHGSI